MGERKVINKYIPPDFDPSLIPRGKKLSSKDGTVPVRMMLPFSMQCATCHTFLYRGRKYNSRKEAMGGPDGKYLGITRWRFYIKCNHCSRPITFLTDPKNADYEMESGATRNYEIHRDKQQQEEQDAADTEHAKKLDPMKALEDRVLDSQREMADLDNLEEIKAMNARHVQLMKNEDGDVVVPGHQYDDDDDDNDAGGARQRVELTAEDEALVKSIRFGKKIKRLNETDEALLEAKRQAELSAFENNHNPSQSASNNNNNANHKPVVARIIKKRKVAPKEEADESIQPPPPPKKADLTSLLGGYGSDSSDDAS